MKYDKLSDALNEVRDAYIAGAVHQRKRSYAPWISAVAAVLAVVILAGVFIGNPAFTDKPSTGGDLPTVADPPVSNIPTQAPGIQLQFLAAAPKYPQMSPYPIDYDADAYTAWWTDVRNLHDQPLRYGDNLTNYFSALIPTLLADAGTKNAVCSPVNIYMALAMLAETTGGNSRQQLMALLNADSIEHLRTQADHVWNAHYWNDGLSTSILANSLWLEEGYPFRESCVQTLAQKYYASVFQGDFGSKEINACLQSWLNEQTGGLLQEQVQNVELSALSSMALASTLNYQVQWQDKFWDRNNTQGIFHAPAGDTDVTFMNNSIMYGTYYWGADFAAMSLPLEDGSRMWLILPDEGKTPADLLKSGNAMALLSGSAMDYPDQKRVRINLSLPKFDICADMQLQDALKTLGITDIFDSEKADFSPLISSDDGGYISAIAHSVRVAVDEEGVTAAAFTLIQRAGAAMPPEDEIDFILDRPFLFVIQSNDRLPLFSGIVNQP